MCTNFQRNLNWVVIFHVEHLWNDPYPLYKSIEVPNARLFSVQQKGMLANIYTHKDMDECQSEVVYSQIKFVLTTFGHSRETTPFS